MEIEDMYRAVKQRHEDICQRRQDRAGIVLAVGEGVIELALHREPCNELGSLSLDELEKFAEAFERFAGGRRMLSSFIVS